MVRLSHPSARIALAVAICTMLAHAASAQTPKQQGSIATPRAASQVPIFAGAKRVASDSTDKQGWEQFTQIEMHALDSLRSQESFAYEVAAHPEDVYKFYMEKLGGQGHRMWSDFDFDVIAAPGATTIVYRWPNYYIKPSDAERQVLSARPALMPDKWICLATFVWLVREADGDVSQMMVAVHDAGAVRNPGIARKLIGYSPRTRVVVMQATYVDPSKAPPTFKLPKSSPFYCF